MTRSLPKKNPFESSPAVIARSSLSASSSGGSAMTRSRVSEERSMSAALLRLAGRPLAAHDRVGADPRVRRRISERLAVALDRVRIGVVEILGVLLVAHPEVREVMNEATEDRLAVLRVRRRVEDVLMPHLVD